MEQELCFKCGMLIDNELTIHHGFCSSDCFNAIKEEPILDVSGIEYWDWSWLYSHREWTSSVSEWFMRITLTLIRDCSILIVSKEFDNETNDKRNHQQTSCPLH